MSSIAQEISIAQEKKEEIMEILKREKKSEIPDYLKSSLAHYICRAPRKIGKAQE